MEGRNELIVQGHRSQVEGSQEGSRLVRPGSQIEDRKLRVEGSKLRNEDSRVASQSRGSQVERRGSHVKRRDSKLESRNLRVGGFFLLFHDRSTKHFCWSNTQSEQRFLSCIGSYNLINLTSVAQKSDFLVKENASFFRTIRNVSKLKFRPSTLDP